MKKQYDFSGSFQSRCLPAAKERLLQLLYPRRCPVCGRALTLPHGWTHTFLQDREGRGVLSRRPGDEAERELSFFRSCMICPDCRKKLQLLSEPRCIKCSRPLDFEEELLCDLCRRRPRAFDAGSSLWLHDEAAKTVLYDLKFRNKKDNADLPGLEMALYFHEHVLLWRPEVLIPVPLHKKRFRERGFNQAQLLAEKLSFWLNRLYGISVPVDSGILLRCQNTKPQRTLEASMRSGNVGRAFAVSDSSLSLYRSAVLVDDIFTSGATVDACAKTLKESGVRRVFFLTASVV